MKWILLWINHDLRNCNGTRTHNHLVRKPVRPVWLNGWVFVYELNGCGFESRCGHLIFRYRACLVQGVPWHSGNYRLWIHSETRTWDDKNIQSQLTYTDKEGGTWPKSYMTCFSNVSLVNMSKGESKGEIIVLFERTCFMNGPFFNRKKVWLDQYNNFILTQLIVI